MTDNKHAEAVATVRAILVQHGHRRSSIACEGIGGISAEVDATAAEIVAALNTRPDVEAMREACARVADDEAKEIKARPALYHDQWQQGRMLMAQGIAAAIRSIPVPTSGDA